MRRRLAAQQRQAHDEFAPLTEARAASFDRPVVHFHQFLDQGQTEAQPVARALQRTVDLREDFEDSAKLVRGDADAGISHSDHRLVAFFLDR